MKTTMYEMKNTQTSLKADWIFQKKRLVNNIIRTKAIQNETLEGKV